MSRIKIPEKNVLHGAKSLVHQTNGGVMTGESRTAGSLKGQLAKLSGIISKKFNKAKRYLIAEMLYGIRASKDLKTCRTINFISVNLNSVLAS